MNRYEQLIHTIRHSWHYRNLDNRVRRGWYIRGVPIRKCETVLTHTENMVQGAMIYTKNKDPKLYATIHVHDLSESICEDYTPSDNISPEEKWNIEYAALGEILRTFNQEDAHSIHELVLDYKYRRTPQGILAKEFDKIDAGIMAFRYEAMGYDVKDFFPNTLKKLNDPFFKDTYNQLLARTHDVQNSHKKFYEILKEAPSPHYLTKN